MVRFKLYYFPNCTLHCSTYNISQKFTSGPTRNHLNDIKCNNEILKVEITERQLAIREDAHMDGVTDPL